ncbi:MULTISPECIES: hypothetical protein [Bacteroides]|uniref:hypothetical protein n=2 Tax=Bacteroides TaxID=816 RepID=UPI001B3C88E8|nr:hypothetical protein [Bacteroides sp. 1001302B_160321_D4]
MEGYDLAVRVQAARPCHRRGHPPRDGPPTLVVPMPHPYVGVLLKLEDFLAAACASYLISPPQNTGDADVATLSEVSYTIKTVLEGMLV